MEGAKDSEAIWDGNSIRWEWYEMRLKSPFPQCQGFVAALPQGQPPIGLHWTNWISCYNIVPCIHLNVQCMCGILYILFLFKEESEMKRDNLLSPQMSHLLNRQKLCLLWMSKKTEYIVLKTQTKNLGGLQWLIVGFQDSRFFPQAPAKLSSG